MLSTVRYSRPPILTICQSEAPRTVLPATVSRRRRLTQALLWTDMARIMEQVVPNGNEKAGLTVKTQRQTEPSVRLGALNTCMPAKSKKQQMAAGAALAAKRGDKKKSSLRGASKSMASSMSEKELEKMASTKRKNLPKKKGGKKS